MNDSMFSALLKDHINCLETLAEIEPDIEKAGKMLTEALKKGKTTLTLK
jgi:hypothetical protein